MALLGGTKGGRTMVKKILYISTFFIIQNSFGINYVTAVKSDGDIDSKSYSENSGSESAENNKEISNALIKLGKQHEERKQLRQALDCYKAASVIEKGVADEYIKTISSKMNESKIDEIRKEEISVLTRGAESGNAEDAYKLGKIYLNSNDIDSAIKMFDLASKNRHQKAPYKLAVMFEKGDLVPIDLGKAEEYYKIGAMNGHPECCYIVSKLIEIEAKKDPSKEDELLEQALRLRIDAASRGHAIAAAEVGYQYAEKNDHIKAKEYFEKAKKNSSPTTTMMVSLKHMMDYSINSENMKIASKENVSQ